MPAVLQDSQQSTSTDLQALEHDLGLTPWSPRQEIVGSLPYFDESIDITRFGTESYLNDVVQGQETQRASPSAIPDAQPRPLLELDEEFFTSMQNLDDLPQGGAPLPRLAPGNGSPGAHVRDRLDMSQMARDGAKHWAKRVAALRAEYEARYWRLPKDTTNQFEAQIRAAHGKVKAQKECVLRFLQLAAWCCRPWRGWAPASSDG